MKYLPTEGMKEALLRNAIQIWLRLEEKLAAKPTDEVSRWVHLHFLQRVSAAQRASFKDNPHAAESFFIPIIHYRHATSSERFAPTFPSRGRHSSSHFAAKHTFFAID